MKSSSNKLNKVKDLPKGDNTANKEFANMEQGTPEIFARSRLSLDENSSRTEEEKDMQLEELNNLLFEQRRELEQAQEALKESQQQQKETYEHDDQHQQQRPHQYHDQQQLQQQHFRLNKSTNHHHNVLLLCKYPGCLKEFTSRWSLTRHLKIHSGIKSFKCNQCNKQFIQKCSLTRHEQTHLDEKPCILIVRKDLN
jgi:uncharacterized Zn-finger protein